MQERFRLLREAVQNSDDKLMLAVACGIADGYAYHGKEISILQSIIGAEAAMIAVASRNDGSAPRPEWLDRVYDIVPANKDHAAD